MNVTSNRISDITSIINVIWDMVSSIFNRLNSIEFSMLGYQVSFLGIILGVIILSLIISVFWKGAKA